MPQSASVAAYNRARYRGYRDIRDRVRYNVNSGRTSAPQRPLGHIERVQSQRDEWRPQRNSVCRRWGAWNGREELLSRAGAIIIPRSPKVPSPIPRSPKMLISYNLGGVFSGLNENGHSSQIPARS